MAEYRRDSYGKIYSALAERLLTIVNQYDDLAIEDAYKYESTLYICVIQSLLTQFHEKRNWAEREGPTDFTKEIWNEDWNFWGIRTEALSSSEKKPLTIKYVVENLRHILSHPHPESQTCSYESTHENGKVNKYRFTRKNREDTFIMEMRPLSLKALLEKLSNYLSEAVGESSTTSQSK